MVVLALLVVAALLLGMALHPLAVDDAFITYRYAQNLAAGNGFAYNVGRPILSTTAPLYALLLSIAAWLGIEPPAFANGLSAVALCVAAVILFALGTRERNPWVGALAALLFVTYPLLWLSLGLEMAVFLALALGAILAYRGGRLYLTAALLALATLTRPDGLILTAVIAIDYAWRKWPRNVSGETGKAAGDFGRLLGAAGVYAAITLPVLAWLTCQFGSPLPATLGAKVAQSELGVTGFYTDTTYLQGLGILARARLAQSPLYLLLVPAVAIGLGVMWRRGQWVRLVVAWGAAHLAGYTLLGVAPYSWYYAPLVPALVCSAALGVVESMRWVLGKLGNWGVGVGMLWAAGMLAALLWSDVAMIQALDGPVPPPDDPVSKVLPEAKTGVYEQAGRWLRDHTPAQALVGVTEVGIMGYYSGRPMIDFLGLLEPDVAAALGRGDLYWALLRYQPDYLALIAVSPLYACDLRADAWFQAAYEPVHAFDDPRFWGSPLIVYRRRVPRVPLVEPAAGELPPDAKRLGVDFAGHIRLLGAVMGGGDSQTHAVQPGDVLALTLYWEALGPVEGDYTVFVHLLGEQERVIAQRDTPLDLGAQPTSEWQPGQVVADPYLLALPEAAYAPDKAVWEVGLYDARTGQRLRTSDGGDNLRFGVVSVLPADEPLRLDFGSAMLTGYELDRLALSVGETLYVALRWEGKGPAEVTVQLVSEKGEVAAQVRGDLSQDLSAVALGADATPGAYDLEVLVADPIAGGTLPLLGADGQPRSDRAFLTKVRLYP
jgi:hypothetical protein